MVCLRRVSSMLMVEASCQSERPTPHDLRAFASWRLCVVYFTAISCLIWNFSMRLRSVARVIPRSFAAWTWFPLVSSSA